MNKAVVWVALCVAVVSLVGCGLKKSPTAENPTPEVKENVVIAQVWDTVKVDYVGTLEDGTMFDTSLVAKAKEGGVFDETRPYEPLTVNLGKGEVIPGFENWIVGMKVGETKKITLTADDAYGPPREELIQKVPVDTFSGSDIVPEVGKTYNFGIAQGTIKEVSDTEITIDFNHPLAGKTLIFDLTVTDIIVGGAGVVAPTEEVVVPEEALPEENMEPGEENVEAWENTGAIAE